MSQNKNEMEGDNFFQLNLQFRDQRFRSKLTRCSVEPLFDDSFMMELQPTVGTASAAPVELNTLLQASEPIYVVLVRLSRLPSHLLPPTASKAGVP